MYRRFTKISVIPDTPALEKWADVVFRDQNADPYYFALNHPKRFMSGNTALHGGAKMAHGTRVVHFSGRVVHAGNL